MAVSEEIAVLRSAVENPVRTPVIALAGLGRSGSTVIEAALGAASGAAVLGEVMHIWERSVLRNELCGCGLPFADCDFWAAVGERAFGGWDRIDARRLARQRARLDRVANVPRMGTRLGGGDFRFELEDYVWHYEQIYAAACSVAGTETVIDSSKQPSLVHALLTSPRLDVRVVHVVRDPRAVAHAWTKVVPRPEARDAESGFMTRYSPAVTARHWMVHNSAVEGLRARGAQVLRVRYEDFVADPVAATGRLLDFTGLARDGLGQAVQGGSIAALTQHSCSGNPMRFTAGPIAIRPDTAWRDALSAKDSRVVSTLAAPLIRAYGYPARGR